MVKLSIITVVYNTPKHIIELLRSIERSYPDKVRSGEYEVIISDNSPNDLSRDAVEDYQKQTHIKRLVYIKNEDNYGFAKANNICLAKSTGEYVLFLNPDMQMNERVLPVMMQFMYDHPDCGASTCRLMMPDGVINDACHRGFPTPWNAFCHFSGLARLFPKVKFFAGYSLSYLDLTKTHEIDALAGSFMLVPRGVGEEVGWWDEDYFLYGEDIDFCFRLKKKGWKIYFVPSVEVLDYKNVSMGLKKVSQHITTATSETRLRAQRARFDAMKIFFRKHYQNTYPPFVMQMSFAGIDLLRWYFLRKTSR